MGDPEQTNARESAPSNAQAPAPAPPSPPAGKRSRAWLWVVVGIAAALVIAAIVLTATLFGGGVEVPDLAGLPLSDATAVLEDADLVLGEVVYTTELPTDVNEGDVVGQLPPAGKQVEKGTAVDLIVARGAQTAVMTDVIGMTAQEATGALEALGFKTKTITVQADAPEGVVVDQSPEAGATVEQGSEVTVVVSAGPGESLVPNVVGQTQDDATAVLEAAGYVVDVKTGYDETVEKGLVTAQSPAGGTSADPGTTVEIVVSLGVNPEVEVPNVVGMTEKEAAKTLEGADLEPVSSPSFSDTVPAGIVISQSPEAGATAPRGGAVNISVSEGPKPVETVTVPDVVGRSETEATDTLTQAGFQVMVARAFNEDVAKDLVITQAPPGGSVTLPGITVGLLVSDGPAPGSDFVTVPDLTGMTRDEATAALQQAGLEAVFFEFSTELAPEGVVFAQLPPPEYSVAPGSTVLVVVSKGPLVQVNPL